MEKQKSHARKPSQIPPFYREEFIKRNLLAVKNFNCRFFLYILFIFILKLYIYLIFNKNIKIKISQITNHSLSHILYGASSEHFNVVDYIVLTEAAFDDDTNGKPLEVPE